MSAPIRLLSLVWDHMQEATSHSWLKVNHAMADALSLAIRSGMRFDLEDFGAAMKQFRPGYWRYIENAYREAVLYHNASAYQAIERHLGRKPFIVKPASCRIQTGDGPCGLGLARLIVAAEFQWRGELVHVGSFNDEKGYVNASSYKRVDGQEDCPQCKRAIGWSKAKELHRYRITHADIRAARRAQ